MNHFLNRQGFLSLCYHYLRPIKTLEPFPKILGLTLDEFENQVKMLQKNYQIISLNDVVNFTQKNFNFSKTGMLFTFDDGLSDHYEAAKILSKFNINGVFYIPTCIFDNEPANPNIIHYCLANYGINGFISEYIIVMKKFGILSEDLFLSFNKKIDNPWITIEKIKKIFKYKLDYIQSRKVLLTIYKNTLLKDFPNIMEIIHLTKEKTQKMIEMGHYVGVHTHTHISVAPSTLTSKEFEKELILPKKILEETFSTNVDSLSYPFGEKQDCLSSSELLNKTKLYKIAFTVNTILNTDKTHPLNLGRYQPLSTDNYDQLKQILDKIVENTE